jgi:hypothetical protein
MYVTYEVVLYAPLSCRPYHIINDDTKGRGQLSWFILRKTKIYDTKNVGHACHVLGLSSNMAWYDIAAA